MFCALATDDDPRAEHDATCGGDHSRQTARFLSTAAQIAAVAVAILSALAAVLGAWRWYRVEPSRTFWALTRSAQAAAGAQALVAGVLAASGFAPADGLFWLYALLPVAVSFVAEQLRLASAQTVLDARGIEDAQAVGRLERTAQRSVVLAIVRREIGVMAVAMAVIAFLALRGLATI
jgi:hypothetical protein